MVLADDDEPAAPEVSGLDAPPMRGEGPYYVVVGATTAADSPGHLQVQLGPVAPTTAEELLMFDAVRLWRGETALYDLFLAGGSPRYSGSSDFSGV